MPTNRPEDVDRLRRPSRGRQLSVERSWLPQSLFTSRLYLLKFVACKPQKIRRIRRVAGRDDG